MSFQRSSLTSIVFDRNWYVYDCTLFAYVRKHFSDTSCVFFFGGEARNFKHNTGKCIFVLTHKMCFLLANVLAFMGAAKVSKKNYINSAKIRQLVTRKLVMRSP